VKRYKINTKIEKSMSAMDLSINIRALSVVEESPSGDWVHWSDVEALREHLEAQIPDRRIAKLERALGMVSSGKCPECEQRVIDFKPPLGPFGPEAFATLRENGIDPCTGHKFGCSLSHTKPIRGG
jgi:hypothetical protein